MPGEGQVLAACADCFLPRHLEVGGCRFFPTDAYSIE